MADFSTLASTLHAVQAERDALSDLLDATQDRLAAAGARTEAAEQALGAVLDCKGWGEGTVTENGGRPAICTACEDIARAALAGREDTGGR